MRVRRIVRYSIAPLEFQMQFNAKRVILPWTAHPLRDAPSVRKPGQRFACRQGEPSHTLYPLLAPSAASCKQRPPFHLNVRTSQRAVGHGHVAVLKVGTTVERGRKGEAKVVLLDQHGRLGRR